MTNKMTITDRINAINFDSMTSEDFDFLVERALKSVRPAGKKSDKPTKAQIARQGALEDVANFVAERGTVSIADVMEAFNISNQKAARLLRDADGVVKVEGTGKGKVKVAYTVAE